MNLRVLFKWLRPGWQASCLVAVILYPGIWANVSADSDRAISLLRKVDDMWRGDSSHAVMTMLVKTANYTRTMKMETWSKGKDKTLVSILAPKKEKGTATLKSDQNIYSYLPKTDRTIRLTSGMMGGSWMGSHFTNDDLVAESRRDEDYEVSITFEGQRDGQNIIEFTLIPRPDAAVVWGKLVLIMLNHSYLPVEELFYDEDLKISRRFTFNEVKMLGGEKRPSVMRVIPADKPDEYTQVTYGTLELDIPIKDSFFSITRLKRPRQ